jgi:hypothetical protein
MTDEYHSSHAYQRMRFLTVAHTGWTPCFLNPIVACRAPVRERWPVVEKVAAVGERGVCGRSTRWLFVDVGLSTNGTVESYSMGRGGRESSKEQVLEMHGLRTRVSKNGLASLEVDGESAEC